MSETSDGQVVRPREEQWDAAIETGESFYRAGLAWWTQLRQGTDLPITANQFLLLRAFAQLEQEGGGASFGNIEIAEFAAVDPATANRHLLDLAAKGLIDRAASITTWMNQMTPAGHVALAAGERRAGEASLAFLARMGGLERWEGELPRRNAWRRPRRRRP